MLQKILPLSLVPIELIYIGMFVKRDSKLGLGKIRRITPCIYLDRNDHYLNIDWENPPESILSRAGYHLCFNNTYAIVGKCKKLNIQWEQVNAFFLRRENRNYLRPVLWDDSDV